MTAHVFRYEVPVDDQWHTLNLSGDVLHVAARKPDAVEFWAVASGLKLVRQFRVFGTGHPLPADRLTHRGSTLAADGQLVWHLFERRAPTVVLLNGVN